MKRDSANQRADDIAHLIVKNVSTATSALAIAWNVQSFNARSVYLTTLTVQTEHELSVPLI